MEQVAMKFRSHSTPARWAAVLLVGAGLLGIPQISRAQIPHLDPIPWHTPADSTSRLAMVVDFQRFSDDHTGWNTNRVLLSAILPAGNRGTFFLRIPHQTFDTGGLSLKGRWPWVIGEDIPEGWPGESRLSSFGQLELGVTGPLRLPLMGAGDYALALGLPMGSDRVYPFSSTSLPMRLALRKPFDLGGRRRLNLSGTLLQHMGSGKDYLTDTAFPSGYQLGASFDWYRGEGGRFGVAYDYHDRQGRLSQLVAARLWFPWSERGAIGLEASREIAGTLDRPAAWYFTLSWRLNSGRYRAGHETPPEVIPGTLPDEPPKPQP